MNTDKTINFAVNIDWLAFSYKVFPTRKEIENNSFEWHCPKGYQLVDTGKGTNVFKNRFYVLDLDGRKKITILCNPNSRIIDPAICCVQFENESLYTREWLYLLDLVRQLHEGAIGNFTRVDLCLDFDKNGQEYLQNFLKDIWRVKGYQEGSCFYDTVRSKTNYNFFQKDIKQINWGSKTSAFKWKLYNKTKEINTLRAEVNNNFYKQYIIDTWKENGLKIINNDIYRLECSITDCHKYAFENYRGDNLLTVENFHKYEPYYFVYSLLLDKKFKVVENGTNNKISLFDLRESNGEIKRLTGVGDRVTSEILSTFNKIMGMLETNSQNQNIRLKFQLYEIIKDLCIAYNLFHYLQVCYNYTLESLKETLDNNYKVTINYGKLWD